MKKEFITHAKKIWDAWSRSKAGTFGASVAYYTVFSIAPLLVITITITSLFLDTATAQASIIAQFQSTFGSSGASFIQTLIESKASPQTNILLSIAGFVILLLGAMGIFSQLQQGLDTVFENLPSKIEKGLWSNILQKLLSLGMVLSIGFLLLVSLVLTAVISSISGYFATITPGAQILGQIVELIVSLLLLSGFLGLTYKILPSKRLPWKPALMGGLITGILFLISKYLLGLYLGSSEAFTSYGAASSLVLLIIWTYYMAQVFLLGAIIIRLYLLPNPMFKKN